MRASCGPMELMFAWRPDHTVLTARLSLKDSRLPDTPFTFIGVFEEKKMFKLIKSERSRVVLFLVLLTLTPVTLAQEYDRDKSGKPIPPSDAKPVIWVNPSDIATRDL